MSANKFNSSDEKDKFLESQKPPTFTQEEKGNLHRTVTRKKIESAIKILPTKKSPGPDGFIGEFY